MKYFSYFVMLFMALGSAYLAPAADHETPLTDIYQKGKIRLVQTVKINADSLPEGVHFKRIRDMALNKYNHLFISDNYNNNMKMFDDLGKFIKVIGQKGEGPGDLSWPGHLGYTGKSIIVWEIGNKRLSFFSDKGDFVNTIKPASHMRIEDIKTLPNGFIILEKEKSNNGKNSGQVCTIDIYTENLEFKKKLFEQNVLRSKYLNEPMKITISTPFQPDVSWAVAANGNVVIGFQKKYEIGIYDVEKGKLFSFNHQNYQPIKITEKVKKKVYDSYSVVTGPGKRKAAPKALLEKIPFPDYRPAFGKIIVDPENNILVFPPMNRLTEEYQYVDVFDPQGKFIKKVEIVPGLKVPVEMIFQSADSLWCLTTDDDYEQVLVKYKIRALLIYNKI